VPYLFFYISLSYNATAIAIANPLVANPDELIAAVCQAVPE